jgi:hypothetical protein
MTSRFKKKSLTDKIPCSLSTPNLSISSPIKIQRKNYLDGIKNKSKVQEKIIVNTKKRIDQNGCPILKNSKMHKITFCDQLPILDKKENKHDEVKNLYEIILIESYKQYNMLDDNDNSLLSTRKIFSCRCIII